MKALKLSKGRETTPSASVSAPSFLKRVKKLFLRGVRFGFVLFVALTVFTLLDRCGDLLQESLRRPEACQGYTVERPMYVPSYSAYRPAIAQQRDESDYHVMREQNRFYGNVLSHVSRTVNRFAR